MLGVDDLSSNKARVREADSVKISNYPNAINFRAWQSAVRLEVVSASGVGEEAFDWIIVTELPDTTFGSLANSGPKFVRLDHGPFGIRRPHGVRLRSH